MPLAKPVWHTFKVIAETENRKTSFSVRARNGVATWRQCISVLPFPQTIIKPSVDGKRIALDDTIDEEVSELTLALFSQLVSPTAQVQQAQKKREGC